MWSRNFSRVLDRLDAEEDHARGTWSSTIQVTCVFAGSLVCAARTARAIVSELKIRTAVLKPPQPMLRCALASWNAAGDCER